MGPFLVHDIRDKVRRIGERGCKDGIWVEIVHAVYASFCRMIRVVGANDPKRKRHKYNNCRNWFHLLLLVEQMLSLVIRYVNITMPGPIQKW